jgi:hypothetical protein
MNRKKNNKPKSSKQKAASGGTQPKRTPFSDAGAIVGSKLGTMFNAPYLKGVGKWLGSGIGQIFGSGDYTLMGGSPNYNVLMNGSQIPKFNTTTASNVVCHREYIGDIAGLAAFTNRSFPLNPGIAQTFPWLSTVAQNYQQYRFHGLIFEFRPLITDFVTSGAPGVVIMATNYNSDEVAYSTKQEMENSEYAVSVKPTLNLMHGIECAVEQTVLSKLYVRTGANPANLDLKFTDLGKFQFASQSNPVQNLGELWVSYCVEFFKPKLPNDVGGNVLSFFTERSGTIAASDPLGTTVVSSRGDFTSVATSKNLAFTAQPGNYYQLNTCYTGTVAGAVAYPIITLTNATPVSNMFAGAGGASLFAPTAGSPVLAANHDFVFRADDFAVVINYGLGGTLPTGTTGCQITLTQWSSEAIP